MRISDWSSDVCSSDRAAGEIARRLGVQQSTLSDHLRALAAAGVVIFDRQGRSIIYRANSKTMLDLIEFMRAMLQTLKRFTRLGSCTVKVSSDERFQSKVFYRRCQHMCGVLAVSIRHQLQLSRGKAVRARVRGHGKEGAE